MAERSDALKKAQQKYMERFAVARVRMEREKYEAVQTYAEGQGMSVNALMVDLLDQAMERDGGRMPPENAQQGQEGSRENGTVSLPYETIEAAQRAAKVVGEVLPDFVARAMETQAQRDIAALRLGINPVTGGKLEKEV